MPGILLPARLKLNELTAHGYEAEVWGPLAELGAFSKSSGRTRSSCDNLQKGAGYELVNLNVHYNTDLQSDYFKSLSMYAEVRNVFDRTYVASANNITDSVTAHG